MKLSVAFLQVLYLMGAKAQVPEFLSFYEVANGAANGRATVPLVSGGQGGAVNDVSIGLDILPRLTALAHFPGGDSNVETVDFRVASNGAIDCPTDACTGFWLFGADYCGRDEVAPYALYGDGGDVPFAPPEDCALPAETTLTFRVAVKRSQGFTPVWAVYSAKVKFVEAFGATTPAPVPIFGSCPEGATMRSVGGIYTVEFESFANRDQYCDAQGNNCEGGWVEGLTPSNGIDMKWEGLDWLTSPGRGVSTIDFYVDEPGIYQFDWRSHHSGAGSPGSPEWSQIDSWVRINADESYAMDDPLDGTKHYAGDCGPPGAARLEGSSDNCYFKVFRPGFGDYWWNAKTGDNESFTVYAVFNETKVYTMDIAARSHGHKIDKIALYKVVDLDGSNRVDADEGFDDAVRAMEPVFC